ncbi:MAG: hypothetical protein LBI45_01970 [Bacteroidales bacterium]|jgi:hypothetical protein|nr:hypothetical protein [Bacteroidales bacterium]
MKKLLFILIFTALFFGVNAQGGETPQRSWELIGNAGTTSRNFLGTTDAVPLIFKTNGIEQMRILSDGNIGIGTDQPQAKLHIEDGEILISKQLSGSPYNSNLLGFKIDNSIFSLDYILDSENTGLHLSFASIPFMPPISSLLFLGNNGLGVGTSKPQANLEVVGSFKADSVSANKMKAQNANIDGFLTAKSANIAGTTFFKFPAGYDAVVATDRLNVGNQGYIRSLGVESFELQPLQSKYGITISTHNDNLEALRVIKNNSIDMFTLYGNGTFLAQGATLAGKLTAQTANITGNTQLTGNVGIGKAPDISYKLDVNGPFRAGYLYAQQAKIAGEASISGNVTIGYSQQQAKLEVNGFFTGQSAYFTGNVGIGISNPTQKLDVNGTIRATEVKVCLSQGCDFVFEENYALLSLNDLETFIKTNNHLPEVAPATAMEAEGINISEMTVKLLQKIEELTLYILLQEKKMLDLQNQINELKNR